MSMSPSGARKEQMAKSQTSHYREMLEKEKDNMMVSIATPDHHHYSAAHGYEAWQTCLLRKATDSHSLGVCLVLLACTANSNG